MYIAIIKIIAHKGLKYLSFCVRIRMYFYYYAYFILVRSATMKKEYVPAELDVLALGNCDIITSSRGDEEESGGDFDSGYNGNGWT